MTKVVVRFCKDIIRNLVGKNEFQFFSGTVMSGNSRVNFPTLHFQNGLILSGGRSLVVEELHELHPEFANRPKRSLDHHDDDADGHVVIYESTASGGECGIKPKNAKRMRAPQIKAVELDNEGDTVQA